MARFDTVQVCLDLERFKQPALMGALHCQSSGAGEIFPSSMSAHGSKGRRFLHLTPTLHWPLVTNTPAPTAPISAFFWTRLRIGGEEY